MSRKISAIAICLSAVLCAAPAAAQDYYGSASPLEGAYVGGYAGGNFDPNASWALGAMAGVNFEVTPGFMAGLEAQGGLDINSSRTNVEGLMLARGGAAVTPDAMIYGSLGAGSVGGTGSWAIGGGAEAVVAPQIGVRGDVLATGPWGSGLNRTKATAGLVWHVK